MIPNNPSLTTFKQLESLLDMDMESHKLKDIALLFLTAANDWPTFNQAEISEFVQELKKFYGNNLTIQEISNKRLDIENAWCYEAGASLMEIMKLSENFCNEANFDKILQNIIDYYGAQLKKIDFIAELKYLTAEEGGRSTPAASGYRPQLKFEFSEMQTSGQQTFLNKKKVYPGDTVDAAIKIVSVEFFANKLSEGLMFEFREGPTVIGTGKITDILNLRLIKG